MANNFTAVCSPRANEVRLVAFERQEVCLMLLMRPSRDAKLICQSRASAVEEETELYSLHYVDRIAPSTWATAVRCSQGIMTLALNAGLTSLLPELPEARDCWRYHGPAYVEGHVDTRVSI
jgi:hypothetical protein